MNIEEKPIYIYFHVGYPAATTEFIPAAAKKLGINLKLEYHGCVIRTLYEDKYGLKIYDSQVQSLYIDELNEPAFKYYTKTIGKNWLKLLEDKALELYEKSPEDELPF